MKNLSAIVLAAGKGTRMKSSHPKLVHEICGVPMIYYPLKVLGELGCKNTVCLTGHGSEAVREAVSMLPLKKQPAFTLQREQLGTGHAVKIAFKALKGAGTGDVLILSGDVPLIKKDTLKKFITAHRRKKDTALSFITVDIGDGKGYGRVIRDSRGELISITEDKDLLPTQRHIGEINSGIYIAKAQFLKKYLPKIKNKNAQKEYYLTDLVSLALRDKLNVQTFLHGDPYELRGINDRLDLSMVEELLRDEIREKHMRSGVTMIDPFNTYIESLVKIGSDVVLEPNTYIEGTSVIGTDCRIEAGVKITDSVIGSGSHIKSGSIIESSVIKKDVTIGPLARLRPESVIDDGARIGNFVEIKKSKIGKGSKAGHLSYIGDSIIGKNVNIGAGVITCNYDGVKKYITIIEDNVFVGSDSQLVAPIRIGKGSYIGSGSTITKDVPAEALSLTRGEQRTIKDWAKLRLKAKKVKKRNK
ncbi:MAG: bifunctional UDP-N-acetylglucosamine diphosphorylase/glucosamine-1-phosphate N-acetyltransferase GlmU [Deltaproteobacteria bacterium]|nr:bifunctional UDP-N-acetylglucosamine diphosphorylase/glucosamine-1-phosphate N-acetyltransferase GlmU [Deltaproteobacteria bacterium]